MGYKYKYARKLKLIREQNSEPLTCHKCLCTKFDEKVLDSIDWTVCEIEYKCKNCGTFVSYWSYGYFCPWFH